MDFVSRVKDFVNPQSPDYYKAAVDRWLAKLNPWVFNRASRLDVPTQAAYEVMHGNNFEDFVAQFSAKGRALAYQYAINKVIAELATWNEKFVESQARKIVTALLD